MGRPGIVWDETKIQRWIEEGRGQNEGAAYKPWLTVRDVPSLGFSSRIQGWKTNRPHHLLSNHETDYFYIAEWSKTVVDRVE